jgi:hypothetical protein
MPKRGALDLDRSIKLLVEEKLERLKHLLIQLSHPAIVVISRGDYCALS